MKNRLKATKTYNTVQPSASMCRSSSDHHLIDYVKLLNKNIKHFIKNTHDETQFYKDDEMQS